MKVWARSQGGVSIRSPHRSKGRLAPHGWKPNPLSCFNPLPSPKQGETGQCRPRLRYPAGVSIRSPHRSKGRRPNEISRAGGLSVSIRSPHRSKGRPPIWKTKRTRHNSFNPLPSPKQGETRRVDNRRRTVRRFNPLPSPKQGETGCRSSRRMASSAFQSAPLTEARGDAGCCNQRNTNRLHKWMREPPFSGILLPKREHIPRCNLLLAIKLLTARKHTQNAVTPLSRTL